MQHKTSEQTRPLIDFVVLWVDGNDPEWLAKKAEYSPAATSDASPGRYRDWDNLRYWFRAVAKYAPWVRRIHFVSDGQVPAWLNTENEKIHIVSHKDYIPQENLPLFNSNAIEIGLHRIPDLAEHFVYFNDDFFLCAPVAPDYYFHGGSPVDMAGLTRTAGTHTTFGAMMSNNYAVLNRHFDKKKVLRKGAGKWFRLSYGKTLLRTVRNLGRPTFDGIVIPHLSVAYRKSDFERVWASEGKLLAETQQHRFREPSDLTHFLFRFYRLCQGDFYPRRARGRYFSVTSGKAAKEAADAICRRAYPEICINDCCEDETDFLAAKEAVCVAFAKTLPENCEFEKTV